MADEGWDDDDDLLDDLLEEDEADDNGEEGEARDADAGVEVVDNGGSDAKAGRGGMEEGADGSSAAMAAAGTATVAAEAAAAAPPPPAHVGNPFLDDDGDDENGGIAADAGPEEGSGGGGSGWGDDDLDLDLDSDGAEGGSGGGEGLDARVEGTSDEGAGEGRGAEGAAPTVSPPPPPPPSDGADGVVSAVAAAAEPEPANAGGTDGDVSARPIRAEAKEEAIGDAAGGLDGGGDASRLEADDSWDFEEDDADIFRDDAGAEPREAGDRGAEGSSDARPAPPPPPPRHPLHHPHHRTPAVVPAAGSAPVMQEHSAAENPFLSVEKDEDQRSEQRPAPREKSNGGSWDFEEDDADIFNEDGVDDGGGGELDEGEAGTTDARSSPPHPHHHQHRPYHRPPAAVPANGATPVVQEHLVTRNPFLSDEDDKGGNRVAAAGKVNGGTGDEVAEVDDDDAGDGWSDDDFFEDDDFSSSAVPSQPTAPPPPPPQRWHQRQSPVPPPAARAPTPEPPHERIRRMLSNYVTSLHDPALVDRLDETLRPSASQGAPDLRQYYAARPGLRKYTLGMELDRLDYELILPNGKSTSDNDVIRSYFGVGEDGGKMHGDDLDDDSGKEASAEEVLVRSANQSLLADLLAALTGPEDDLDIPAPGGTNGGTNGRTNVGANGRHGTSKASLEKLILSGPALCMTSVAESCRFALDLRRQEVEAACMLAISVPYNGNIDRGASEDGRLVLARVEVSVNFRPGDASLTPLVRYAVRSVASALAPDSAPLHRAAIELARDHHGSFLEEIDGVGPVAADARDRFLLSHHLLSDAGLLASDRLDRIRDAAGAGSAGFRGALRQLDDAVGVSSKFRGGLGGLALPSAEAIEAAEREAVEDRIRGATPPPPPGAGIRFPRPDDVARGGPLARPPPPPPPGAAGVRFSRPDDVAQGGPPARAPQPPPPPPPPPPMALQPPATEASARPRPLIGGLFMSGLSRLAAATQPDESGPGDYLGGGGGTGLTPPGSPSNSGSSGPVLYRREDNEGLAHGHQDAGEWDAAPRGFTGLTPLAAKAPPPGRFEDSPMHQATPSLPVAEGGAQNIARAVGEDSSPQELGNAQDDDAGWSDDEFDFDDEVDDGSRHEDEKAIRSGEVGKDECETDMPDVDKAHSLPTPESKDEVSNDGCRHEVEAQVKAPLEPYENILREETRATPTPPPPPQRPLPQRQRTFEEEFVVVLKEKIESECRDMKSTGRMKRWKPLSEDPEARRRLMGVMVSQIRG
ncbi:hypothetical protein ACHAWF_013284 [Thalassiosira exigua]